MLRPRVSGARWSRAVRAGASAAALTSCLSAGCLIDDPKHCANIDPAAPNYPCAADEVCSAAVGEANGCVPGGGTDATGTATASGTTDPTMGSTGGTASSTASSTATSGVTATSAPTATSDPGTTTATGTSETASGSGSTTGPECDAPADGDVSGDCGASTPHCIAGACAPCDDLGMIGRSCADVDPALPACGAAGACVECTATEASACTGATPVCEAATQTCRACEEHSECPASACDLELGSCLPTDRVWWVDNSATNCVDAAGSRDEPLCALGDALARVGDGEVGTVRLVRTNTTYAVPVAIGVGRRLALRGEPVAGLLPALDVDGGTTLAASGMARAFVSDVRIAGSGALDPAATASGGARLYLDDVVIEANAGAGLSATSGARVFARRTELRRNGGTGLEVAGASEVTFTNTIVARNGDDFAGTRGVRVVDTNSVVRLRYTTVAGNSGIDAADSVLCAIGGRLEADDSILVAQGLNSVDCPSAQIDHSVVDGVAQMGTTNLVISSFVAGWFVNLATGDARLVAPGPFAGVAKWDVGDPATDIDGTLRPTVAGAADVAGAHLPQ